MSSASDSDSKTRKAQMFFQYGNDAAMKNNYDYAIQMYREACKLFPANILFRQSLRGIERRKFGNDPNKVGNLVGAKTQGIKIKARGPRGKANWEEVLAILEEVFVHNPWDIAATMEASEAAQQLGYGDVAMWLCESVVEQGKTDVKFLRFMAKIYEQNQSWQRAINCWELVRKINPYDEDAIRQMNSLAANATIQKSGMGETLSDGSRHIEIPQEAEDLKASKLSPEERLLKDIKDQPNQVRAYLELADLYKSKNKLEDAAKILERACKIFPEDDLVRSELADLQISRLKQAIEHFKRQVEKLPDEDEPKIKLEKVKAKLVDYEIAEFRRRSALKPDDAKLHFELGMRLKSAGKNDEAIAEFQQARNSPEFKVKAMYHAGLAFEANGVHKLAERSYQEALKFVEAGDSAMSNALHYQLGRVAEAQSNFVTAEEHYNEVAANDYSYLDVARRLRALNQRPPE